nr:hypothetical protein [Tanacetum cinerariifolium]
MSFSEIIATSSGLKPLRQLSSPIEAIRQFTPNWPLAAQHPAVRRVRRDVRRALAVVLRRGKASLRARDGIDVLRHHPDGSGDDHQRFPGVRRGALGAGRGRGSAMPVVDRRRHGAGLRRTDSVPDVHPPATQHRPDDCGVAAARGRSRSGGRQRRPARAAPAGQRGALHGAPYGLCALGLFGARCTQHPRDPAAAHGAAQAAARKHGGIELA